MLQAQDQAERISIHALCEEGDSNAVRRSSRCRNFYPRPLRGGRPGYRCVKHNADPFLSTPSARRATSTPSPCLELKSISIHALCEEGDRNTARATPEPKNFYPRPLRGGRPLLQLQQCPVELISIHALCEEGDPHSRRRCRRSSNFYPRPLRGGRPGAGNHHPGGT